MEKLYYIGINQRSKGMVELITNYVGARLLYYYGYEAQILIAKFGFKNGEWFSILCTESAVIDEIRKFLELRCEHDSDFDYKIIHYRPEQYNDVTYEIEL